MKHLSARMIGAAATVAVVATTLTGCSVYQKAQDMHDDSGDKPAARLTDQQTIELIDSLRSKGSYEAARDSLSAIAGSVADKISGAIPGGATWAFDTTSGVAQTSREGLPCSNGLGGHTALKPYGSPVVFDPPFSDEGFKTAAAVLRDEAAKLGATEGSSLFDESAKRDFSVSGNGYKFRLLQLNVALLTVTGDCHLLQRVIDLPPGQLPPGR